MPPHTANRQPAQKDEATTAAGPRCTVTVGPCDYDDGEHVFSFAKADISIRIENEFEMTVGRTLDGVLLAAALTRPVVASLVWLAQRCTGSRVSWDESALWLQARWADGGSNISVAWESGERDSGKSPYRHLTADCAAVNVEATHGAPPLTREHLVTRAPELLHWFHLSIDAALDLPGAELVEVLRRLQTLPPIGRSVLTIPEGG